MYIHHTICELRTAPPVQVYQHRKEEKKSAQDMHMQARESQHNSRGVRMLHGDAGADNMHR